MIFLEIFWVIEHITEYISFDINTDNFEDIMCCSYLLCLPFPSAVLVGKLFSCYRW